MSARRPRTLPEWAAYLGTLDAEALWAKAVAANQEPFVHSLYAEGYTAEEVEAVFTAVALRFRALNEPPPLDGWFDLRRLAQKATQTNE